MCAAVRDHRRHSEAEQRPGPDDPVIVVITGTARIHARKLDRSLTKERGFVLVHCQDAFQDAVRYCQRLAPCVWILRREDLAKLEPSHFSSAVDFGRAIQVLVWMSGEEPATELETLLRSGCMGFLGEDATGPVIRRAVRAVSSGEYWTSRKLATRLLQRYLAAEAPRKLTNRETEIMQLVSQGYRNREIAEKLFISRETVRWHLRSLYGKVGTQDRLRGCLQGAKAAGSPAPLGGRPAKKPVTHQRPPMPSSVELSG